MPRESLPDPLLTSSGDFVASRAELDAATREIIFGSSAGGTFSMLWGLPGWEIVPDDRLPRIAWEARELLREVELVGFEIGDGTRALLERLAAQAEPRQTTIPSN